MKKTLLERIDSMAQDSVPWEVGPVGRPGPPSKHGTEREIPPKLFVILKMRMRELTHHDILSVKEYGGEKNDLVVNINPKKFDIRWNDLKTLANKFGMTGLKYEDHQIRMWFAGDIIWDVIR